MKMNHDEIKAAIRYLMGKDLSGDITMSDDGQEIAFAYHRMDEAGNPTDGQNRAAYIKSLLKNYGVRRVSITSADDLIGGRAKPIQNGMVELKHGFVRPH